MSQLRGAFAPSGCVPCPVHDVNNWSADAGWDQLLPVLVFGPVAVPSACDDRTLCQHWRGMQEIYDPLHVIACAVTVSLCLRKFLNAGY